MGTAEKAQCSWKLDEQSGAERGDIFVSGIFGVLDRQRHSDVEHLLARMGSTLAHREWYVVETYAGQDLGIGIGRIGVGIFNQERQPVWSEDCTTAVWLSGELYGADELRRELELEGFLFRDKSDPELVLRLYQERGTTFVRDLEGAFVLAIWDYSQQELVVANDRFGRYPVCYAHYDGKLLFAPEMKGILCDPGFRKELDLTALAEYVRFQRLLGDKTFFRGLVLLPHASLLRYDLGSAQVSVQPYWDFDNIAALNICLDDAVAEAGRLISNSVSRACSGPYRMGVYLSGGKDSRLITGLAARVRSPLHSVTFGARDSRDVVYARRIAKRAGTVHHYFEYTDGRWVQNYMDLHLKLTEGFHNWVNLHGISTMEPMREHIDLQLTGFCGDHLLHARFLDQIGWRSVQSWDSLTFRVKLFDVLCHQFTWPGLDDGEAASVYADPLKKQLYGRAWDSLEQELVPFEKYAPLQRFDYFKFLDHAMRLTHNYVLFYRSAMEVRYPFLDYALFDLVCGLPAEVRYGGQGRLYRNLLNRLVPDLTLIPLDKDERLLTNQRWLWAMHAVVQRGKRELNRHFARVFPEHPTLYADYERYLRTDLRDWGEHILFDKRTLERGIWNPQFLRSIWARHQSGRELHTIGKIAPIMTYEMMLRQLYD